ncbi:MAG: GNAT family N-acetyltransferase [Hyphomicrobium sp.]|jgi:RimJ/RimL family protein N-acetyltransferase
MRTRRLKFREIDVQDVPRIAHYAGDWDVARMTARIPYPYSEQLAFDWMANLAEDEFVRAILFEGEMIGAVGYIPNGNGTAEIGYWLGKPWWGRGFATEAASALMRHCFLDAGFTGLTCCHFTDNAGSARVIAKLGFRRSGMCTAWCDARQAEVAAVTYERRRPLLMARPWTIFRRRVA